MPTSCSRARDDQAVAVGVADLAGEQLGRRARAERVQAEAVGRGVPDRAALEEVEGAYALGQLLHGLGREDADGVDDVLDARDAARRDVVGDAHDGDDERDVGLDGLDDLGERHAVAADEREQAVARLGEGREALECLECGGQTAAVALARPCDLLERPPKAAVGVGDGAVWLAAMEALDSSVIRRAGCSRACRDRYRHLRAGISQGLVDHYRQICDQGLSARSMRARVSSRPSTATVSKMPGETARPASATRSGW